MRRHFKRIKASLRTRWSLFLHNLYFKTLSPEIKFWNTDRFLAATILEYIKGNNNARNRHTYFYYDFGLDYELSQDPTVDFNELKEKLQESSDRVFNEIVWLMRQLAEGRVEELEDYEKVRYNVAWDYFKKVFPGLWD